MSDFMVVAFGGNAILPPGRRGTMEEQRAHVRLMCQELGRLVNLDHRVVVTHGNGPQVGEIMLAAELAREEVPEIGLDMAGAMSQAQIGYMLQQEIGNYLELHGERRQICTVLTQVLVDADDPAFSHPTKPIGRVCSAVQAREWQKDRGWILAEDPGRGLRRVVPSPTPQVIIEWPAIKALVDRGVLVIAAGGGGIPVVHSENGLRGVEAVIDKDLTAQRLASLIAARTLVLLTEVDSVVLNYGTSHQRQLGIVSLDEMRHYAAEGQFPDGSMGPKVRAALEFLESGGERAIITSAANLVAAVHDRHIGTQVMRSVPVATASASNLS